jgi:two-component system cell cycle sensor histidine kinase/response regulator CckA
MHDNFKLTNNEKALLKKVLSYLEKNQSELVEKISKILLTTAFENRFTLQPRRLRELGSEEVLNLKNFLQSLDTSQIREIGEERALEGLGEKPLLSLCKIIRGFFLEKIKPQEVEILKAAIKATDVYMASYLFGFIQSRENQTLKDQEQLRKALSTALDRQRRELFIKNHAIHTYINGIMLTELEGNITYVNPAFIRMWHYNDLEEVLNLTSTQFLGAKDFSSIMNVLQETGGWQHEFIANRNDGSSFDLVVSASLIRDDTDQPIGIMATFVDVTDRRRLEAQFRQSQKMEALGQLAGGIVHDFNNLLQVISGYTSLELMHTSKESDRYNNLIQIRIATERGKGLTEQLRFFTRQDTGTAILLSMNNVVKETYNLLKRTFQPEIRIDMKLDHTLRTIKADPSQMSQLLMNLCVNARDAMIAGQNTIKKESYRKTADNLLTLETSNVDLDEDEASQYLNAKPGSYVCVKVRDTGVGMQPELIERLFEPFFTTKSDKTGIGLGLAVVYGIVQNHNGFFDVHSKIGEGSTFEIYLPVFEEAIEKVAAEEEKPSLDHGKGAVLVVEDERQVRDLAVKTLEKCGYTAIIAKDGAEALSLYKNRKDEIDLVVLDVVMPKMGGWECFHRLKEIEPSVKVLIMTGYTTDGSVQDFLKEGAKDVILKPFDLDTFATSVKKILGL